MTQPLAYEYHQGFKRMVIVHVLAPESLVAICHDQGTDVWSIGKQRKDKKCRRCGVDLPVGSKAFRPIGNQLYRAARLCVPCVIHAPQKEGKPDGR